MTCTDHSWHALWEAFNTHQTDKIRVPRAALADVVECHGEKPQGLVELDPRVNSQTILVNRASLFEFLNRHGATRCDFHQKEKAA